MMKGKRMKGRRTNEVLFSLCVHLLHLLVSSSQAAMDFLGSDFFFFFAK